MNKIYLFFIRLILAGVIAVVLMRIFRPDATSTHIIGLGAGLVGLAYGLKYIRQRKTNT